jgi:hypothetical protein
MYFGGYCHIKFISIVAKSLVIAIVAISFIMSEYIDMHSLLILRHRGTAHSKSEPPLWNHPPSIQVATRNRQVEREMVVAEAPSPTRLWSSSRWSVINVEPAARCMIRNRWPWNRPSLTLTTMWKPSASGIQVSHHPKMNPGLRQPGDTGKPVAV